MRALCFLIPFVSLFSAPGIEYRRINICDPMMGIQSVHLLEVDPAIYEIKPVRALDEGVGRESLLSLSRRHGAVASINGGFFAIGGTLDGLARGALKIHDWYALPLQTRGSIGWSSGDAIPQMDRLRVDIEADDGLHSFFVDGLNRARREGEMLLFTPCFHRTTLTDPDGEELMILDGVIQSIVKGGSSKIPEGGYVLSIQEKHPLFHTFEVGMELSIIMHSTPTEWDSFDYIVGGAPLLIHHNTKITDFTPERTRSTFLTHRHARTAIGLLSNGHWLFIVVDKTELLDGMTICELRDLMADLGCTEALNLDGGGSSTMVYENLIKNSPRGDEDESFDDQNSTRRISDAIVVCPKSSSGLSP